MSYYMQFNDINKTILRKEYIVEATEISLKNSNEIKIHSNGKKFIIGPYISNKKRQYDHAYISRLLKADTIPTIDKEKEKGKLSIAD